MRCREIGERGGRTGCRVVAVYAIMGIEADENRPGRVYGQVLHKCWGWPSGHHCDVYSGEFSAVVVGVAFLYLDVSHGLDPNSEGRLRRRTALGLIGGGQPLTCRTAFPAKRTLASPTRYDRIA